MTEKEILTKINQVKAVVNQPQDTWRNALAAIGIPADIANRAAQYGYKILIASVLYLQLCKCEEAPIQKHRRTERAALLTITCELERYENGVDNFLTKI